MQYVLTPISPMPGKMLLVLAQVSTALEQVPGWSSRSLLTLLLRGALQEPKKTPLEAIGFYAINRGGQVAAKAAFMRAPEVSCELLVDPDQAPYLLVPCTFTPVRCVRAHTFLRLEAESDPHCSPCRMSIGCGLVSSRWCRGR